MTELTVSRRYPVSAEVLWELVGGFNALPEWHPAVYSSELEQGGTVRRLHLVDGGEIVERLERVSEEEYVYTYSVLDSSLPVSDCSATLKLEDDGVGGCRVTWSGSFAPVGIAESDAVRLMEGIYRSGLENLGKIFGVGE